MDSDFASKEMAKLARLLDLTILILVAIAIVVWPKEGKAGYEEVQIVGTRIVSVLICQKAPPGYGIDASQPAYLNNYPSGGPVTLQEGIGALTWVVTKGAAGYYVFKGSKIATAFNVISDKWMNSKPEETPEVDRSLCYEQPVTEVHFRRIRDNLPGAVIMKAYPTGKTTLINFCPGPRQGDSERPC